MFEVDMKIAAMHVKRKQLHQLLPTHVLPKKKKHSTEGVKLVGLHDSSLDLSVDSDNSMSVPSPTNTTKNNPLNASGLSQGRSSPATPTNSSLTNVPNLESNVQSLNNSLDSSRGSLYESIPADTAMSPAISSTPKPVVSRVVTPTRLVNQVPKPFPSTAVKLPSPIAGVKRTSSPQKEESPKKVKTEEV
ncbi:hypothetical protein AB205_0021430, partial [Aquarana catesbeiana]